MVRFRAGGTWIFQTCHHFGALQYPAVSLTREGRVCISWILFLMGFFQREVWWLWLFIQIHDIVAKPHSASSTHGFDGAKRSIKGWQVGLHGHSLLSWIIGHIKCKVKPYKNSCQLGSRCIIIYIFIYPSHIYKETEDHLLYNPHT